jgi:hypothetical protein
MGCADNRCDEVAGLDVSYYQPKWAPSKTWRKLIKKIGEWPP